MSSHKPRLRLQTNGYVYVWMGKACGWKSLGHIRDPKAKLYRRFGYGI
jgi:hypothetical protein